MAKPTFVTRKRAVAKQAAKAKKKPLRKPAPHERLSPEDRELFSGVLCRWIQKAMVGPLLPAEPETLLLALEIADEGAESIVCSVCGTCTIDGHEWYRTEMADPEDTADMVRPLRYLELRGLLQRHATQPHLVRVKAEGGR